MLVADNLRKIGQTSCWEKQARLVNLILKTAREEVWEALDEHLCDYEHREAGDEDVLP